MMPTKFNSQITERAVQPHWLFPILLLILLQVAMIWQNPGIFGERVLSDADGYTRLARVEALAMGGAGMTLLPYAPMYLMVRHCTGPGPSIYCF